MSFFSRVLYLSLNAFRNLPEMQGEIFLEALVARPYMDCVEVFPFQ